MSRETTCPSCSSVLPVESRYCGSCGRPVSPSSVLPTEVLSRGAGPEPHRPGATRSAPREARFLPGVVLAGRYRIMGLLGRGGMGEVYRADDLKLGQPVALKFLPPGFERDPERQKRLLDEVRTARQISHANVCRIYDVGEADGHQFLSMEYVDGEDLASLLRRIGRLPKDKAIQIARQLCAGLAASHEIGVLHRDLKPANVMIDGRGRARITDFGLAGLAEEMGQAEARAGTPAYMAPEQLAGTGVTVRSDLYALGLVLYELFTGKPAFRAESIEEQRRLQSETTPSSPSSFVEGFDPSVERVILRCLDPEPSRRPPSALAVAAALPGGDPLAAALAAGETPSPEMVADAGDKGAARPAVTWGALAVFLAALAAVIALSPRTSLLGMVRLEKPPVFLRERAREILALAGDDGTRRDSLFAFDVNRDYLEDLERRPREGPDRWSALRTAPPAAVRFWYRQSPGDLTPLMGATLGTWLNDPPDASPGMARVGLDADGRLLSLLVVPGQRTGTEPVSKEPDWDPLLRATGVDPATLAPARPEWAPPVFADRRAAWTGSWPGNPGTTVRIEAASAGGRPVSLRIVDPWTRPAEAPPPAKGFWLTAAERLSALWFLTVVVAAGIVALRNVRRGRGDRRGALRLALYLGAVRMTWYLGAHHVASPDEVGIFIAHLSYAMQRVGLAYVFYLAVEPYARRLWPQMLVSWVRALDGRFRDPLVGRDLLIGCAAAALGSLGTRLSLWVPSAMGGASALPVTSEMSLEALRGPVSALVSVLSIHTVELLNVIFPVTMFLVLRLLFRHTVPAVIAVSLLATVLFWPRSGSIPAYLLAAAFGLVVFWLVLLRVGLLAFATMFSVGSLLDQMPIMPRPESWYLGVSLLSLAFALAPAVWGFWTSRAGQPLFREEILEAAGRN